MDLPTIKRLIVKAKDRERKSGRRKFTTLETSRWSVVTALCIAAALQGDCSAAAEWLTSSNRRGRPLEEGIPRGVVEAELSKLYAGSDNISLWADPVASPLEPSILSTALKWSSGFRLRQHVRSANVDYGAPVRSVRMIEHYNIKLRQPGVAHHVPAVAGLECNKGRKWCERWRVRHGAAVGCLRSREPVPLPEKRNQALLGLGQCCLVSYTKGSVVPPPGHRMPPAPALCVHENQ